MSVAIGITNNNRWIDPNTAFSNASYGLPICKNNKPYACGLNPTRHDVSIKVIDCIYRMH